MMQYLQRHLLSSLAKHSETFTHSQRYELEEQLINYNMLSRKNKSRILKLKSAKLAHAEQLQEQIDKELDRKEKTVSFNTLHLLHQELLDLKSVVHELMPQLSQKEIAHYRTIIHDIEHQIKERKSILRGQ